MTTPIRVLDTGLMPARWNVAMTAALAERHREGLTSDTIRLHRYRTCVLLGRSQDPQGTVDVGYCRARGIELARRVTGGGCVFMGPGTLAWDVVIDRRAAGLDLESLTRRICEGVAGGLVRLGVAARFRPPNDVETAGLKISGSSGLILGRSALLQGTVLVADDIPIMASVLRTSEAALRGCVTCVGAALKERPPPLTDVAAAVLQGLALALDRTPLRGDVEPGELARADGLLQEEIGTEAFVMGEASVPEIAS
jgi:lipoate-protein ligase A